MRKLVMKGSVLLGASALVLAGQAAAEPFGLLNGRTANVSALPDTSVEAGAVLGDLRDFDYEHFGARFNYKVNPTIMAYGDLGQSDVEGADGFTFGVGGFFQVDGVIEGSDFGVHASVHRYDLEDDNSEAKGTSIMIEALFSGQDAINANGNMFWNASLGLNRISGDGDSDTELTFGGGISVKNASGSGEFFAGALFVDDLSFGGGYRHYLQ